MTDIYEIRDVKDEDFDSISDLAGKNELLLEGLTPLIFSRMLKWLYGNSDINKRVQILAQSTTKVIAHYGGVPFNMKWYEKSISVVLASNLVVNKSFRKQSLFFALQKEFIKSYQEKGYSFAYGAITRKGVLNPHLRMGWKSLGALHVYIRPISFNSIFKKIIANSLVLRLITYPLQLLQKIWDMIFFLSQGNVKVIEEAMFNSSLSPLLREWMNKNKICSERSVESLNWRFSDFHERGYQILIAYINSLPVGYMVVRLMPMKQFLSVAIVDLIIFNNDKNVFNALIRKSIFLARQCNADLVVSALTDHDNLRNSFRRNGFLKSKEKFTIVGHFPKNGKIKFSEFHFSDFHINWFDHDYV